MVEESDGDVMGDGVNIAARLEGVAKPGAICLSEDAYRQVRGRSMHSKDLGPIPLKNVAEPLRAFAIEMAKPEPGAHEVADAGAGHRRRPEASIARVRASLWAPSPL